jgi:hypothetical protein
MGMLCARRTRTAAKPYTSGPAHSRQALKVARVKDAPAPFRVVSLANHPAIYGPGVYLITFDVPRPAYISATKQAPRCSYIGHRRAPRLESDGW